MSGLIFGSIIAVVLILIACFGIASFFIAWDQCSDVETDYESFDGTEIDKSEENK